MLASGLAHAQSAGGESSGTPSAAQPVIIDTDIGDDIDDALAVGLALASPELNIVGITTTWGNTALRARMVDRLLCQTGRANIPVAVGIEKHHQGEGAFSQAKWAERQPARSHPDAVNFMLEQIRAYPNQLTLIAIGPLTNVAAALDSDPNTFKQLKRIVMMGGSIKRGYDDLGYTPDKGPSPEYNIAMDVDAAKKVFAAGVPIYMMPLDSTQLKLDEVRRDLLFTASTPLTDALAVLTALWSHTTLNQTPTMFDAVAVTYAIRPDLCPATPMNIRIDDAGYTRPQEGGMKVSVCMQSDSDSFFQFYLPRLMEQKLSGSCPEH